MVYRKKSFGRFKGRRRRTTKKKYVRRKATGVASLRRKVNAIQRSVEVKQFDGIFVAAAQSLVAPGAAVSPAILTMTNDAVFTPAGFVLNSPIIGGVANGNRVGNKITMKSLKLSFNISVAATLTLATCSTATVRWLLVVDSDNSAASTITWATMFASFPTTVGTTSISTGMNLVNRKRFRVLRDKYIDLGYICGESGKCFSNGLTNTTVNEYIPLNGMVTEYATNGNVATYPTINGIYFIIFSDFTGILIENVAYRIRYTDF
jgi:hypothetical protein